MVTFWIVFVALAFSAGAWLSCKFADAVNTIRRIEDE